MLLVLTAVAVLLLPGGLLAVAVGLRGLPAVAGAPLLGYGLTAVAGPTTTALGLRWGPLPLIVATGLACALAWMARRPGTDPPERTPSGGPVIGLGVLAGAVLGAVTVLRGTGGLDAVHQGWDAAFHANAIRLVLDTGLADPSSTGLLSVGQGADYYYPNALHVLSALTGQVAGADVPALIVVQMMLVPGIAGLGLAALVRHVGGPVAVAAVVPLLLSAFGAATYDLYSRGPLLPYATGLALLPGLMLLLLRALDRRRPAEVLAVGLAAAGLLAVHPGAALSAACVGLLLTVQRAWGAVGNLRRDVPCLAAVTVVAVLCGLPYLAGLLGTGGSGVSVDWPAQDSAAQALGNLVRFDPGDRTPQLLLLGLVMVGLAGITRLRALGWWLAVAVPAAVGFVAVSVSDARLVEGLTQPWWNDRWRFMALVVVAVVPLAALGVVTLGERLARLLTTVGPTVSARLTRGVAVLVVLAAVGVASGSFYADENRGEVARSFRTLNTVDAGERLGMSRLASLAEDAGATGRVMNDPGDGSAWMYALDGVRPVFGFSVDTDDPSALPADQQLLMGSFRCLDSDPAVRELVRRYDIGFVFTGAGFVRERFERIPGLRDLDDVRALERVYAGGGTVVYRVRLGAEPLPALAGSGCAEAPEDSDAG